MPVILLANLKPRALCHQDCDSDACLPNAFTEGRNCSVGTFQSAGSPPPGGKTRGTQGMGLSSCPAGRPSAGMLRGSVLGPQSLAFHNCLLED